MRIINCVAYEHNLWLVLIAAVICALGTWITIRLGARARKSGGLLRLGWIFLGAIAAGSTIWCTHFVAMLAYESAVPVTYDPGLTALSLLVAIVGAAVGIAVSSMHFRFAPEVGGATFGSAVAAMHYTGMMAFTTDAVITWDSTYIVVSVILATTLAAASFNRAARWSNRWQTPGAAALLLLAIVSLHFTGMAAMTLTPLMPADGALTDDFARNTLAIAVAGVCLLVLGTGVVSNQIDRYARELGTARLNHLMESSVDGMVVEQNGRIVTANASFEALVGRSREEILGSGFRSFCPDLTELVEDSLMQVTIQHPLEGPIPAELTARRQPDRPGEAGFLVFSVRDIRSRLEQERRALQLARTDSLTGLPNRVSFLEKLETTLQPNGSGKPVCLLAIDLDRFKEINDLHGHAVGDGVLRIIAGRMRAILRSGEFIARLGGDEFIALSVVSGPSGALEFAQRVQATIRSEVAVEDNLLNCGGSIGIAIYPDDAATATKLMNNADLAMYRAKSALGSSICFYETAMDEAVRLRRRTTSELRAALARDEFELRYQIQVSITSGVATGYEALLRWKHPERGYVPPSEFIPLAEESGVILAIGEWVLRAACSEAASWSTPHKIAVNLSAVQLGQAELPSMVHRILLETGLSPARLELEITETAMILDPERTTHVLRQIKALGVSIAMDDFGVGYSSLSTLRAFPFDKIKLDKSFMDEIENSLQARAIIQAVLTLGRSLEIPIIAEGVETTEQFEFLRQQGCDEAQGYLIGRPGTAPGFEAESEADARPDDGLESRPLGDVA